MAKRKKRKSGGGKRRRRVGALGLKKSTGMKLLALAGGFVAGKQINAAVDSVANMVKKDFATTVVKNADGTTTAKRNMIVTGAQALGGGLLAMKAKGTIPSLLGGVLVGAALKSALSGLGVIKGYQNVPVIGSRRLAGYQNVPVIGGTPSQLAGTPGQLQGFRVNGGLGANGYGSQGSGVMGTVINPAIASQSAGLASASGYMN